jgi:hypothetical protein
MEVHFQHWDYEIPSELLIRYGSPHFSIHEAGRALLPRLISRAHLEARMTVSFNELHILCANEAFPEAAIADPLADLQVWDEWCNGSRRFPYPGRFSRLGLTHQEKKTSSPSSVGVVGEIMAGVFSQAFVGAQVVVRCIRHWPDLIFHTEGDIFAFVESKAFTNGKIATRLDDRIPEGLLREMMFYAVQQLNADPHLVVWGAFTGIVQIQPRLVATVTMIRLSPPHGRRDANPRTELPLAVVKGVAERAVAQAAIKLSPHQLQTFTSRQNPERDKSPQKGAEATATPREVVAEVPDYRISNEPLRKEVEALLCDFAMSEIESVLTDAAPKIAVEGSRELIEHEVRRLIRGYRPSEALVGKRFFEIKSAAEICTLQKVRQAGEDWIFMADLGADELRKVESTWRPGWENASSPLTFCDGHEVWRCGGAAYCCGPETLEYQIVRVR